METMRVSYIILYKENGIKYVFNRSVDWMGGIFSKDLCNILKTIGHDIVSYKISEFTDKHSNICEHISEIDDYLDINNCIILEEHPEFPNENCENQKQLNEIKKEWCVKLNAVDRVSDIPFSDNDIFGIKKMEKKLWDYVNDIYMEISKARRYKKQQFEERIDDLEEEVIKWKNKTRIELKQWRDNEIHKANEKVKETINKAYEEIKKIQNRLESLIEQSKKDEYVLKNCKNINGLIHKILSGDKYLNTVF